MKKFLTLCAALVCGAFLATSLTSCGDDEPETPPVDYSKASYVLLQAKFGLATTAVDDESILRTTVTVKVDDGKEVSVDSVDFENVPLDGELSQIYEAKIIKFPCTGVIMLKRSVKPDADLDAKETFIIGGTRHFIKIRSYYSDDTVCSVGTESEMSDLIEQEYTKADLLNPEIFPDTVAIYFAVDETGKLSISNEKKL